MTETYPPIPVVYRRRAVGHQVAPLKLKTKRIPAGRAGAPIDVCWGGGDGTFFTGAANAIGRIDEHEKVTVFSRSVGRPPRRLARGWSEAPQRPGYRFIDPEGGRIGFFNYERFEEEAVLAGGVRPLSMGPMSYFEQTLVGTNGGYLLDFGRRGKVATLASPVEALGCGPNWLFYYLSGTTVHVVNPDRNVGRPLAMPHPVQADEFVWGPGGDRALAYLDKARNVVGLIAAHNITEIEVEEYELPAGLAPRAMALNIDTLWFTGRGGASVFRFDHLRNLYEYPCADAGSDLTRLSFGSNEVWFTEPKHSAVSRADIVGL